MFNLKKNLSYLAILVIGLGLGLGLTYVSAEYTDQSNSAPNNNTPTPILISDINGDKPFVKIGKLGTGTASTNPDITKFDQNSLVVGGQTSATGGLSVSGGANIMAEIPATDTNNWKAFFFGNPGGANVNIPNDDDFWQLTAQNEPRKFVVRGYTKTPRVVIGSATASPSNYNLYIEPDVARFWSFNGIREYCTLTANDLKNKGCPIEFQYSSTKKLPTYMSQVIPGTGTNIVARCNMMTEQNFVSTNPIVEDPWLGTCYP
jgi:hypothetical protein